MPHMNEQTFFAGWAGGLCVQVACHPLDAIKVHSQVTHLPSSHAAFNLWIEGGPAAFYRGLVAPMAGFGVAYALKFGVYGSAMTFFTRERVEAAKKAYEDEVRRKRLEALRQETSIQRAVRAVRIVTGFDEADLGVDEGTDPDDLSAIMKNAGQVPFHLAVLSAGAGGAAFATAMTPFEVVKLRLVTETIFQHRAYDGAWDCARQLVDQGGLRKLYMGFGATLLRDIPASIIFFGTYGTLRGALLPASSCTAQDAPSSLFAGAVAGAATWLCVLPADVVKTHLQASCRVNNEGYAYFIREIYARNGLKGFYNGAAPAVLRASFAQAICMTGVETAVRLSKYVKGQPASTAGTWNALQSQR